MKELRDIVPGIVTEGIAHVLLSAEPSAAAVAHAHAARRGAKVHSTYGGNQA